MRRALALTTALALTLAACGTPAPHRISEPPTSIPRTSPPSSSTPAATATSTPVTSTSPRITRRQTVNPEQAAAAAFAAVYVRFLDGAGTVSELPAVAAAARAQAAQAGPIPPGRRRGTLVLAKLDRARGATNTYLLSARDDAHTLYAQLALSLRAGRWIVTELTPPDFVQVFASAGPPPPRPPARSAAAEQAARSFLRGYLPWLYGEGSLAAIRAASGGLRSRLAADPPNVPPTMQRLRPRVDAIAMQRERDAWRALPSVTDGHETYELVLTIKPVGTAWQITNVGAPR